jgi:16S rRNA (adenine(1408)-N(1))-methyltransferase
VDADAASMAEASRRATRGVRRGGLANALFVVAAAEALPAELDGIATSLTVHFPWGSLLRGLLDADPLILAGITRAARPGVAVTLLLSVTERDHLAGVPSLAPGVVERIGCSYAAHGLLLCEGRPATAAEVAASHSSWARRLSAGVRRPAWLLRFRVCPPSTQDG